MPSEDEHLDQVVALHADGAGDAHFRFAFLGEHGEDEEDEQDAGGDGKRAHEEEERGEGAGDQLGIIEAVGLDWIRVESRQSVAQVQVWIFPLKTRKRCVDVIVKRVGEFQRLLDSAGAADEDGIPVVGRGQLRSEQALVGVHGQQSARAAGLEIAGQDGVASDGGDGVRARRAEYVEPNLIARFGVQLAGGTFVDHNLVGTEFAQSQRIAVLFADRLKLIGQLRIHADEEELRLDLPGIGVFDRHEVEAGAEDGVDPVVAGEVRLQVEQYLIGDAIAAVFGGGVGLLGGDEVVDAFEAVEGQVADADGERVAGGECDGDDDRGQGQAHCHEHGLGAAAGDVAQSHAHEDRALEKNEGDHRRRDAGDRDHDPHQPNRRQTEQFFHRVLPSARPQL